MLHIDRPIRSTETLVAWAAGVFLIVASRTGICGCRHGGGTLGLGAREALEAERQVPRGRIRAGLSDSLVSTGTAANGLVQGGGRVRRFANCGIRVSHHLARSTAGLQVVHKAPPAPGDRPLRRPRVQRPISRFTSPQVDVRTGTGSPGVKCAPIPMEPIGAPHTISGCCQPSGHPMPHITCVQG